ncbi:peptidoglycan-binding domain 1 protein [Salinisphaera sp. T5B8]|uniref:L,D-transpeptidase family protein n=1 Tax=Salinisphaera sp. T5B8 TaxID=1304154 RepID=UPI003341EA3F
MITFNRWLLAGFFVLAATGCSSTPEPTTTTAAPAATSASRDNSDDKNRQRERATPAIAQARAIANALDDLSDDTVDSAVAGYYKSHDNEAAWFDDQGRARAEIKTLLDALSRADRQGLVTADYGYEALAQRIERADARPGALDADTVAELDIRLSQAFVRYAVDLHQGRTGEGDLRPRWYEDLPAVDYAGALERATRDGDVDAALTELRPPHDGYTRLVKALADYRAIVDAGGWPEVPDGPLLETGVRDSRVPTLRKRLQASGDLTPDAATGDNIDDGVTALETMDESEATAGDTRSPRYDASLASAVEHFQRRHGLKVDGKVGPGTLAALNVPAEQRVRQIEINLERWRWLPADLGERYVMVNIPEYRLRAYSDGQPALEMRVVVGESYKDRATPVFSDAMEYLVFRPYWNVPPGIAADEIVPKVRKDSGYLDKKRYEIVAQFTPDAEVLPNTPANIDKVEAGDLYVRQRGGSSNALGLVKFMFPNEYAVYLHDSPAEQLFTRTERDFSHGCVRVQYPDQLAEFVLAEQPDWDAARIDKALHEGERQRVQLDESIPVYLAYWTAFVDDTGVNFRADLYDNDPRVEAAMRQVERATPNDAPAAGAGSI